jgi:hypothetical protein
MGQYFILIYMRQGLNSKQWSNASNIASELVWSALPIENDTYKIKLSVLLPRLGKTLKKSLETISFNPARQTQFVELFHEYYSLLFKNYRQKPFTESSLNATADTIINSHAVDKKTGLNHKKLTDNNVEARVAANSAGAQALLAKADKGAEVINSAVLESKSSTSDSSNIKPLTEVVDASQTEATGKAQTADTQYINLVDNLIVSVWFEKKDDGIVSYRCRLAAVIRGTSKYIFVNRAGVKVAEETRETLAVLLQQGKLRTLDDGMLFDRALESVITNLCTPK